MIILIYNNINMIIDELRGVLERVRTIETSLKVTPTSSVLRKSYIIPKDSHDEAVLILSEKYDKVLPFYTKIYKEGPTGVAIGVDMVTSGIELYLDTAGFLGKGYSLELDSSKVNIYYIEKKEVAYEIMKIYLSNEIYDMFNKILLEKDVCCTLNKVRSKDYFNFYIRPLKEIRMNKLKTKLLKLIEYINPDELSNVETFINDYKNNALNWLGITLTKSGIINVKIYTVNIFAKHP
jgi:hypothetical protein